MEIKHRYNFSQLILMLAALIWYWYSIGVGFIKMNPENMYISDGTNILIIAMILIYGAVIVRTLEVFLPEMAQKKMVLLRRIFLGVLLLFAFGAFIGIVAKYVFCSVWPMLVSIWRDFVSFIRL